MTERKHKYHKQKQRSYVRG